MSHKELSDALRAVHLQLAQADHLDPEDTAQLRKTIDEIQSALAKSPAGQTHLIDSVSHSASTFEQSHPKLTETLGRIADMLQQMGI